MKLFAALDRLEEQVASAINRSFWRGFAQGIASAMLGYFIARLLGWL